MVLAMHTVGFPGSRSEDSGRAALAHTVESPFGPNWQSSVSSVASTGTISIMSFDVETTRVGKPAAQTKLVVKFLAIRKISPDLESHFGLASGKRETGFLQAVVQHEELPIMQNGRFLGICLLISSAMITAAVVYHAKASAVVQTAPIGRYQFHPSSPPGVLWIIDTTTGEVKAKNG